MDSKKFDIQIPDDQAENIATVGQAISYIEEAKIIHIHPHTLLYAGVVLLKLWIQIEIQSKRYLHLIPLLFLNKTQ
jgi:hypothetical protein